MPKPRAAKRQRFSRASELGALALAALAICEIVPACGSGSDSIQYERGDAGRVLLTGDGGGPITPPGGAGGHRRGAGGSENGDAGPDASATGDGGSPGGDGGSGTSNGGSNVGNGGSNNGGGSPSGGQSGGPRCGDQNQDSGEECDDGNLIDFDGCSSGCTIENTACTACAADANSGCGRDATGCGSLDPGFPTGCSAFPSCGDYPAAKDQHACSSVWSCVEKSECLYKQSTVDPTHVRDNIYCYCGDTDISSCKSGSPQGPCKDEIGAAFYDANGAPLDSGTIVGLIGVPKYPGGGPLALLRCERINCGDTCTPPDQIGAGGSGSGGAGSGGASGGSGGSGAGGQPQPDPVCVTQGRSPPPGTTCSDCEATWCPHDATGCDTADGCSKQPSCDDYAIPADRDHCKTVLGCLHTSNCYLIGVKSCFCGTQDDTTCKASGRNSDGQCANIMPQGFPSTFTDADIFNALEDVRYPGGGAMSLFQCDFDHCAPPQRIQTFDVGICVPYCR